MASERGNKCIGTRLAFFVRQFGQQVAADIDDNDVFDALKRRGRIKNHGGRRADNTWIVATGKPLSAATINRHRTVRQGVLTFTQTSA